MLNIEQLSFWERKEFFEKIDFLIIGAGIVGCSTAFHLKKKYPDAKILMLERGFLPCGASTKNAGFASFGGPVELLDDLKKQDENLVWETVQARYEGLIYLRELLGDKAMDFQQNEGWDIVTPNQVGLSEEVRSNLHSMNNELLKITGKKDVFSEDENAGIKFGFSGVETAFNIALEGQIDTGKMMKRYHQLVIESGVSILHGITVDSIDESEAVVSTSIGEITAGQIVITVNGFAGQLLKNEDVLPARAQVLVTSPIPNLKLKGTFHYDFGYYYFRNFENRILLGGARNLDIKGETTYEMTTTSLIQNRLRQLLEEMIIPGESYSIDYQWSGIMGVGTSKYPIIKRINDKVSVGVRLGGIGVALGTNVGRKLVELL
jgi:gamma-glutamylputrescine oxidase